MRTIEVLDVAGVSFRQIDYWVSHGLVPHMPTVTGSGRRRNFNAAQIRAVQFLKYAAPMTQKHEPLSLAKDAARVAACSSPGSVVVWWIDAERCFAFRSAEEAGAEIAVSVSSGYAGRVVVWPVP